MLALQSSSSGRSDRVEGARNAVLDDGEEDQTTYKPSQLDKFKQAARELETDDDPKRFKDGDGNLMKHKRV